jgi:hypothetical protein
MGRIVFGFCAILIWAILLGVVITRIRRMIRRGSDA